ncbi:MAG: hypothetical protein P4M08_04965 [Oligoflexia bacterium]|nr:hypothetical protein [Oligoflexia bacterium]
MRPLSLAIWASTTWVLLALSGCKDSDLTAACAGKFEKNFADAAESMKPLVTKRAFASVSASISNEEREEREKWQTWADTNLFEIQHLLDGLKMMDTPVGAVAIERRQKLNDELSRTADELVQIHGLVHQGYFHSAISALGRLRQRASRARELACSDSSS